jgi:hypothetical protein
MAVEGDLKGQIECEKTAAQNQAFKPNIVRKILQT